jgi:long-subunit fatty acid transport protein
MALALWVGPAASTLAQTQFLGQDENDLTGRANPIQGAGARALGMGGAFLARADDATAASWNPAGLSYLRRPEVTVVGNHAAIDGHKTTLEGTTTEDNQFRGDTLDFAALTYPLHLGSVSGAAQVSYQRVIPFSGTRTVTRLSQTILIDAHGGFDVIALGTGLQITRHLRVGGTLNRWTSGYHQNLTRNPAAEGEKIRQLELNLDFRGWNTNLGAIWSPVEEVNLAAVFKTSFTGDIGLARMRTDTYSGGAVTTNAHTSGDVSLDFPAALGFGASWRPRSPLTISADYTRSYWSGAYIHNYFILPPTPAPNGGAPFPSPPPTTFARLPWPQLAVAQSDTEQIRGGVEYVVLTGKFKVPIRVGYFSDQQLAQAADGSAPRFNSWTAGTGLIVGPVLFDIAYLYQSGAFVDMNGVRNSITTKRFVASMIYRHGGLP